MSTDKEQRFSFLSHNCLSSGFIRCNGFSHPWETTSFAVCSNLITPWLFDWMNHLLCQWDHMTMSLLWTNLWPLTPWISFGADIFVGMCLGITNQANRNLNPWAVRLHWTYADNTSLKMSLCSVGNEPEEKLKGWAMKRLQLRPFYSPWTIAATLAESLHNQWLLL